MTSSIETSLNTELSSLQSLRESISLNKHAPESEVVRKLIELEPLAQNERDASLDLAKAVVVACRKDTRNQTLLDSFLQEFGLSNKEGVALMCLAEALLRVPDNTTADRLIAEKMTSGDWKSHNGNSESVFVNAATWGMILTGSLIQLDNEITQQPGSWVKRLSSNLSEPVVRRAILQAMRIMGGQYVLGRSIDEGVKKGAKLNAADTRYSFDMLGEAARTEQDAQRYFDGYARAFERVGALNTQADVYTADGISVKLSALHPQYHFAHYDTVMAELLPRITELCLKAKHYNLGLSIDAEEAARLEMSLDIFETLCRNPELKDWDGLGFVLQAYQKRAPSVAQWLIKLGQATKRTLMVRLVKGAYWDAEIKHAQEQGLRDYPVFTRKVNTDACYLHCANILLGAPDTIFSQFATHNAYTAVALLNIAKVQQNTRFEFQRLHGMGELLYKHLAATEQCKGTSLRVYAPIGQHQDLLPYLVRRLLENGANSSFVNRFLDNDTPVDELIQDVYADVAQHPKLRHSQIPLPDDLFIAADEARKNSLGLDLDDTATTTEISQVLQKISEQPLEAHSIVGGQIQQGTAVVINSPADRSRTVGHSSYATPDIVETALARAYAYQQDWQSTPNTERAAILNRLADALEKNMLELMAIISLEAGRTIPDCVSEVREAIDFCRYYALQATVGPAGQGDANGRGIFFCVSPWNFPLAIFIGQVSAALVAGNCVIAKPAEQTPLIAARAIELCHQAGCPADAVHLILGPGADIGKLVSGDPRISGIAFTGSTETAQRINQTIAARPGQTIPLIAETGGQNCMIVDSTALPEQIVDDVISSAFHSAGQRCSALRVLYVQDVIADKVIHMLQGAMRLISVNTPAKLSTDVGPVIDDKAKQALLDHQAYIEPLCLNNYKVEMDASVGNVGTYFAPRVYEIANISVLKREVFGPILHVIRYKVDQLDDVIREINATGYGLTLGVHSRIEAFANHVFRNTDVGNTYVNRNTIGAVVGVNPFGGKGLSGTGPKAGGPNYLHRFQQQCLSTELGVLGEIESSNTQSDPTTPSLARAELAASSAQILEPFKNISTKKTNPWSKLSTVERCKRLQESIESAAPDHGASLISLLERIQHQHSDVAALPGPTGEENNLFTEPRGLVLVILGEHDSSLDVAHLLALLLSVGNSVILHADELVSQATAKKASELVNHHLPAATLQIANDDLSNALLNAPAINVVALSSGHPAKQVVRRELAKRSGPITPLVEFDSSVNNPLRASNYLSFFIDERTKTENLVARGGNTQLFNLVE